MSKGKTEVTSHVVLLFIFSCPSHPHKLFFICLFIFREYADEIKDETVKEAVLRIFHPSVQEDDDANDSKTPSLKTRKQLTKILQSTPPNAYNLKVFQDRLDEFLLKFAKQVFGNADVPTLVKLGYTMPDDTVGDVDDDDETTTRSLFEASDNGSKKKKKKAPTDVAVRGESRQKDNGKRRHRRRLPKELKELKRGRDALNNNHGDDPREESLRIMEQAKRAAGLKNKRRQRKSSGGRQDVKEEEEDDENNSPRDDQDDDDEGSGLEQQQQQRHRAPSGSATKRRQGTKRKECHILDESSSDESEDVTDADDDELEKEYAAITISKLPKKKKARVVAATQSKIYGLPPPDPGIFDDNGNVVKRSRWTDEENTAIKQGVTQYGVGKWAESKSFVFYCV